MMTIRYSLATKTDTPSNAQNTSTQAAAEALRRRGADDPRGLTVPCLGKAEHN